MKNILRLCHEVAGNFICWQRLAHTARLSHDRGRHDKLEGVVIAWPGVMAVSGAVQTFVP